jgi:hypothetical protein
VSGLHRSLPGLLTCSIARIAVGVFTRGEKYCYENHAKCISE